MDFDKQKVMNLLDEKCLEHFSCSLQEASKQQIYRTVCRVVRDILSIKRKAFLDQYTAKQQKQAFYMSMEFLVGPSLRNNLYNLGLEQIFSEVLQENNVDLKALYEVEPDAGLGNGGLGRLASCYMDAMTSLSLPITGFSLRYEFGIFKQKIRDGWQMEEPDNWLDLGEVWLIPHKDEVFEVHFGGWIEETWENGHHKMQHHDYSTVIAMPYDMMISGYQTDAVGKLTLWSAKSPNILDMSAFSRGDYARAVEQNAMAEIITKILYPADDHVEGKILRLKQQYLLVSASLQSILNKHIRQYGSLATLPDKVAIHINDTHPALCVPELMRLLLDEYGFEWDDAWDITRRTLSYTNHTVMSEALERWPVDLFSKQLPRIYQLVCEINRRLMEDLEKKYPGDRAKHEYMAIISRNEVHMANLCLACCHMVNGVSKLHSEILQTQIFRDYYNLYPERFTNVTNGIAYRRWLCQSNPELTALLHELIGDGFMRDSNELEKLLAYHDDPSVLERLQTIKRQRKAVLADYIWKHNDIIVDPDSLFDVQIKRLHEYKRQLLNALGILHVIRKLRENPNCDVQPRTYVFAAKASAGYFLAKQIIRLICTISKMVNSDPLLREKIRIVFLEDYKVSLAELIVPAAEISEQISVAGKEASGTGNMKLMINGAVTIGTLDGANVEIFEQVGEDNIFLFGMTATEVERRWWEGYYPRDIYDANPELKAVVDMLTSGVIAGERFTDVAASLLTNRFGGADAYMTLADWQSYVNTQERVSATYKDRQKFTQMSLVNIAKAGLFSADRAVLEYTDRIWLMKK